MSHRWATIFCFILFQLITTFYGINGQVNTSPPINGGSCSRNYEFDQFILAIQWPVSFCYEKQECNLQIARNKKWLIHGLWPNRVQRSRPKPKPKRNDGGQTSNSSQRSAVTTIYNDIQFCCGPSYNQTSINSKLYRELIDKWPTLHSNGKHHGFWRHEWQKHGTCARSVDQLKTQKAYFETILSMYNQFDLNRSSLQSNRTYQLAELHRIIRPLVGGKRIRIECSLAPNNGTGTPNTGNRSNNNGNKISIFSEVHICLNKSLQPIDCTRNDDYQCSKQGVLFP
ncbi:Ribonuclease T2 [Blomia tropicalis]|nr:Ribonuclease T2 [Blomia tropicalis]